MGTDNKKTPASWWGKLILIVFFACVFGVLLSSGIAAILSDPGEEPSSLMPGYMRPTTENLISLIILAIGLIVDIVFAIVLIVKHAKRRGEYNYVFVPESSISDAAYEALSAIAQAQQVNEQTKSALSGDTEYEDEEDDYEEVRFTPVMQEDTPAVTFDSNYGSSKLLTVQRSLQGGWEPDFDKNLTLSDVVNNLNGYLTENGIQVEHKTVVELISAMASSRLIVFSSSDRKEAEKLIKAVCGYFGSVVSAETVGEECKAFSDLIYYPNTTLETDFVKELYATNFLKRNLCFASLGGVNPEGFDAMFDTIMPHVKSPEGDHSVFVNFQGRLDNLDGIDAGKINLPDNVWYFVSSEHSLSTFSSEVSSLAFEMVVGEAPVEEAPVEETPERQEKTAEKPRDYIIMGGDSYSNEVEKDPFAGFGPSDEDLTFNGGFANEGEFLSFNGGAENVPEEYNAFETTKEGEDASGYSAQTSTQPVEVEEEEPFNVVPNCDGLLSAMKFAELISDAKQDNFLSLSLWNKIDRFEEFIARRMPFGLDNKILRKMEKYTSVYVACGGSPVEAVDSIIAIKILPQLKGCENKLNDGENDFLPFMENLFGADNIPECRKVIKDLGLDSASIEG